MEVRHSVDQAKASTTDLVAGEGIIMDAHRMAMADQTLTAVLMPLAQARRRLALQASGWGCHRHLLLLHTITTTARHKMAILAISQVITTRGARVSLHQCMVRPDSIRDLAGIKTTGAGILGITTEEEEIAGRHGQGWGWKG